MTPKNYKLYLENKQTLRYKILVGSLSLLLHYLDGGFGIDYHLNTCFFAINLNALIYKKGA